MAQNRFFLQCNSFLFLIVMIYIYTRYTIIINSSINRVSLLKSVFNIYSLLIGYTKLTNISIKTKIFIFLHHADAYQPVTSISQDLNLPKLVSFNFTYLLPTSKIVNLLLLFKLFKSVLPNLNLHLLTTNFMSFNVFLMAIQFS